MHDNNSCEKLEFIIKHIIWALAKGIWYNNPWFRCLDGRSLAASRWILFGTLIATSAIGILLEMKNDRNGWSVFFNLSIGFGLYTVWTYSGLYGRLINFCLCVAGLLTNVDVNDLMTESSWEILDCVLHEAYHAYQHCLVDALKDVDENNLNLLDLRRAVTYAEEFDDYTDGEEDFYAYYVQSCERDARAYAEEAVDEYQEKIYAYLLDGAG